ncbi:TetR/AcrR family transcriptional regulator [Photobacterium sp. R1]
MNTETRNGLAGRPVDSQKTLQIFSAIDEILAAEGIARLSIERIASTAKVSKVTLYRRFTNLEGVISAYVESFTQTALERSLSEMQSLGQFSPEQKLVRLGTQVMVLLSQPSVIAFDNAIAAAGPKFQGLKEELFRHGPQRVVSEISAILSQSGVNSLSFTLAQLADMLFQLWKSDFYDELRFTGHMPLSLAQLEQHVLIRTQFFLNALERESGA